MANNPRNGGEHREQAFLADVLAKVELLLSKINQTSFDPCEDAIISFEVSMDEL